MGASEGKTILGFMESQTDKCGWCKVSLEQRKGGMAKDIQGHAQEKVTEWEPLKVLRASSWTYVENSAWLWFGEGQIGKQREKLYCTEWVVCGSSDGPEKTALVGREGLQQGQNVHNQEAGEMTGGRDWL